MRGSAAGFNQDCASRALAVERQAGTAHRTLRRRTSGWPRVRTGLNPLPFRQAFGHEQDSGNRVRH